MSPITLGCTRSSPSGTDPNVQPKTFDNSSLSGQKRERSYKSRPQPNRGYDGKKIPEKTTKKSSHARKHSIIHFLKPFCRLSFAYWSYFLCCGKAEDKLFLPFVFPAPAFGTFCLRAQARPGKKKLVPKYMCHFSNASSRVTAVT